MAQRYIGTYRDATSVRQVMVSEYSLTMETAKERIVRVAVTLFAERGYAGTSVAEIQQAAGLAPGSGALYKHFRSKQEVLEAAIEQHISNFEQASGDVLAILPEDPFEALKIVLAQLMATLTKDEPLIRITLRDLDARPRLADRLVDGMLAVLHNALAAWLEGHVIAGRLRKHDTEAMAALLFSAVSYYRVLDILLGKAPADVSEDRLVAALVDLASEGLRVS
jgi:AcrR family transcriptional regulator